jgi:hypothetical protein
MWSFLKKILRIEPAVTLSQWIYDRAANNLAWLSSTFGGAVIGYAASITEWLKPWGPIGYVALGILFALFIYGAASLFFFIYSTGKMRSAIANYSDMMARTATVNTLADLFTKQRINMADFFHPFYRAVRNVKFQDCEMFGPALIFLSGCRLDSVTMTNCDIVVLSDDAQPRTLTRFDNCTFERCPFYLVTIFLTYDQAAQIREMMGGRELNVISQKGERTPSSVSAMSPPIGQTLPKN